MRRVRDATGGPAQTFSSRRAVAHDDAGQCRGAVWGGVWCGGGRMRGKGVAKVAAECSGTGGVYVLGSGKAYGHPAWPRLRQSRVPPATPAVSMFALLSPPPC